MRKCSSILLLITLTPGCLSQPWENYNVFDDQCKEWSFGGKDRTIKMSFMETNPDMDTFYEFYVCANSTHHHRGVPDDYFYANPSEAAKTITRKIGKARVDFEVLLISLVLQNMHAKRIYNVAADIDLMREWHFAIGRMNKKDWFKKTSTGYYESVMNIKWRTEKQKEDKQAHQAPKAD